MSVQPGSSALAKRDIVIYVADPDETEGVALGTILGVEGYQASLFLTAPHFYKALAARRPDLILFRAQLKQDDGLTVVRMLHAFWPDIPVVPIIDQASMGDAVNLLRAGAANIMMRPIGVNTTREVAEEALAGRPAVRKLGPAVGPISQSAMANLTPREREVLSLISNGNTTKEAARALAISPRTVEVHRGRILEKYGARNVAQLMRILFLPVSAGAPHA